MFHREEIGGDGEEQEVSSREICNRVIERIEIGDVARTESSLLKVGLPGEKVAGNDCGSPSNATVKSLARVDLFKMLSPNVGKVGYSIK